MKYTANVTGGKLIAVSQFISGVRAVNTIVLLRHPWKKERGAISFLLPRKPYKTHLLTNLHSFIHSSIEFIQIKIVSGVSAVNPLVAFYDIHGREGAILLFCPGH
jgi:hypothetical protein